MPTWRQVALTVWGARIVHDLEPLRGLPAQGGGRGQTGQRLGHPVAQAQTGATADPLKLPAARRAHEGTSSDLGE